MALVASLVSSPPHSLCLGHWPQRCTLTCPSEPWELWSPVSITCFSKRATKLAEVTQASAQILPLQRGLPSHVNHTCNAVSIVHITPPCVNRTCNTVLITHVTPPSRHHFLRRMYYYLMLHYYITFDYVYIVTFLN